MCSQPLQGVEPAQPSPVRAGVPETSSWAGQVRVTLLKQKGSLGKRRLGRAAQGNHRATKDPTTIPAAFLFYRWGVRGSATLQHSTGTARGPSWGI